MHVLLLLMMMLIVCCLALLLLRMGASRARGGSRRTKPSAYPRVTIVWIGGYSARRGNGCFSRAIRIAIEKSVCDRIVCPHQRVCFVIFLCCSPATYVSILKVETVFFRVYFCNM